MNFAIVEKNYIRQRIYPEFDWVVYPSPSQIHPLPKPLDQCTVALVTTAGVHVRDDRPFDLTNRLGDHTFRSNGASASIALPPRSRSGNRGRS